MSGGAQRSDVTVAAAVIVAVNAAATEMDTDD